ncbi:PKD domain-containing protein [Pontibacter sp. G13]|uniref:PKD domain-containing protein n=1 Tax=Pontibacter sp. G13 TaxID=3074898 RepID=UPI00288AD4AF|nr:PKD domain-containing protein [Pontibacter sp. G13]WNJ19590.1 PKD domain-containing protein [Pontibacter sp. G13]
MKTLTLFAAAMLAVVGSWAQSPVVRPASPEASAKINAEVASMMRSHEDMTRTITCGPDTANYPLIKATSNFVLTFLPGLSYGQYYAGSDSTPISISGVNIFAYIDSDDTLAVINQAATASIWSVGTDSFPATQLGSANFTLENGASKVKHIVNFATPISVTGDYMVVLESAGDSSITMFINDPTPGIQDGGSEWLSFIQFQGSWLPGYTINLGDQTNPVLMDCDFFMVPHVSYDLTIDYELEGMDCISVQSPNVFTNKSSDLINNRMYNLNVFAGGNADSTYLWDLGDGNTANAVDLTYSYAAGGFPYEVKLFALQNGYWATCLDSSVKTILAPVPNAVAGSVVNGNTVSFTGQVLDADSVEWIFGDGNTSNMSVVDHTYDTAGTYTAIFTAWNTCNGDSIVVTEEVVIEDISSSLNELANASLEVFPNPSAGVFNVSLEMANAADVKVTVTNLLGQVVTESTVTQATSANWSLDLAGQQAGVYLLNIQTEAGQLTRKLIVR